MVILEELLDCCFDPLHIPIVPSSHLHPNVSLLIIVVHEVVELVGIARHQEKKQVLADFILAFGNDVWGFTTSFEYMPHPLDNVCYRGGLSHDIHFFQIVLKLTDVRHHFRPFNVVRLLSFNS